jgi:flagellum-specific ATP synthase
MSAALEAILEAAQGAQIHRRSGTVLHTSGEIVTARGINLQPRELAHIEDAAGRQLAAECAGSRDGATYLAMLERGGIHAGARVVASGSVPSAPVGRDLLGCVLDGLGRPMDGGETPHKLRRVSSHAEPPHPLDREPISLPLASGVRAIDGFLTLGRGQRVGIFAGSGVGKSTLLGMLARGTAADLTVIALIGERGREVRDFIEHDLGADAQKQCVVVASTGDNPAAMRICAARTATAIAEAFRAEGLDVLLLFDSLTRVAMAQREIGLAAGEPPTTKGYPPSVFSMLPHLMERTGPGATGSITAIYTVLVDGEDMDEPVADLARATLDGHIVLKRSFASAGHYPPIDILESVSRLMDRVAAPSHKAAARDLRGLLAAHADARDLISIGAYVAVSDTTVDTAIEVLPAINAVLRQRADEITPFEDTVSALSHIDPYTEDVHDADASTIDAAGEAP